MKKCLIVPYFGKFPNYFQLTLNSCGENLDYDWLLFTDNREKYDYPLNVKVYHMEFQDFKKIIELKLGKEFNLETPYKLCDYKVAYGFLLEEYIRDYDWWGYCDIDVIFGKINNFISENLFHDYDKLFILGHFTMFKNTLEINRMFMKPLDNEILYKKYLTNNKIWVFDERWKKSINNIFEKYEKKIYYKNCIADIYPKSVKFKIVNSDMTNKTKFIKEECKGIFIYDNGKVKEIYKENNKIKINEYMYIHLQKRKMRCDFQEIDKDCYKIIPNKFENLEIKLDEINKDNIEKIKSRQIDFQYIKESLKYSYLGKRIITLKNSINKKINKSN